MNFQRKGSISNSAIGRDFEEAVASSFSSIGLYLQKNIPVEIGTGKKKIHRFDLGSIEQQVIVECKAHTWTETGNVPSAKITTWNQAMYYFSLAPAGMRKIFVVSRSSCSQRNESLLSYYLRLYDHLIPDGVELWEFDEENLILDRVL